jgi:hypothetical protein
VLLSRETEGTALRCLDNQSMKVEYGAKSDRFILLGDERVDSFMQIALSRVERAILFF